MDVLICNNSYTAIEVIYFRSKLAMADGCLPEEVPSILGPVLHGNVFHTDLLLPNWDVLISVG